MTTVPFRCSAASVEREEPLAGTASTVRSWLLLEHGGPWGRDAFADARHATDGLGREIGWRSRRAGVRPLLIRRSGGAPAGAATCFLVRSGPGEPWIERTSLATLDGALSLDLEALGRGERLGLEPHTEPLFLVCTHGRHDACCAEQGRPLAAALSELLPDHTWEASHIGGDRFAGNVLAMPHGMYFGRVTLGDAEAIARGYLEGRLSLAHLRGRSTQPMAAQFADHAVRVELGLDGIDDVELVDLAFEDDDVAVVRFRTSLGDRVVRLELGRTVPYPLTCRARREEPAPTYRVLEIIAG